MLGGENINTSKLVSVLLIIVIGVALLPLVGDMVNDADIQSETETFTAVDDDTVEETVSTSETINDIQQVKVNDTILTESDYSFTGNEITLNAETSDIDDEIIVNYDFKADLGIALTSLLNLLPILFVVVIVGGAVAYVKFR